MLQEVSEIFAGNIFLLTTTNIFTLQTIWDKTLFSLAYNASNLTIIRVFYLSDIIIAFLDGNSIILLNSNIFAILNGNIIIGLVDPSYKLSEIIPVFV